MVFVIVWWGMAWYGLSGMTYCLARYGKVYGMALWAWHGIWYGMVRFGMVWRDRYMHAPFTCTAPVHSGQ